MSATTICGQSFASSLQVKRYPAIRPGIIIDTPDVLRPKFFVVGIDSFGIVQSFFLRIDYLIIKLFFFYTESFYKQNSLSIDTKNII